MSTPAARCLRHHVRMAACPACDAQWHADQQAADKRLREATR